MTDADCTYGGLYINYEYPFVLRTHNSGTFSYQHGSTDNFKEKPRIQGSQLGPFCTRGEGFALVGLLNNIYINKGKTYIILYAFPPYFQIDLIFKVALTPCEGITNPIDLLCRLRIHAVVTPIYHLFCPVKRHGSSSMYIQKDACIVLQQAPPWTVQRSQLTIYSAVGMFTAWSLVSNINIVIDDENPCHESLYITHRFTNGSVTNLQFSSGLKFGHGFSNGPIHAPNVSEVVISQFGSCYSLPLLYSQYQIFNNNSESFCFESSIVRPIEDRVSTFSEYEYSMLSQCALVDVIGITGFYSLDFNSKTIHLFGRKIDYYYFAILDKHCLHRNPIRVYLSKIFKSILKHYLFPANTDKLLFVAHTIWSQVHIDITEWTKCKLQLVLNFQNHAGQKLTPLSDNYTALVLQVGIYNMF